MVLKIDNSKCPNDCSACKTILTGLPRKAKGKGMPVPGWMRSCLSGSLELSKKKIGCEALYLDDAIHVRDL
jgi:hypothetical protein